MATNPSSQKPNKSNRNSKGQFQAKKAMPQQDGSVLFGAVREVTNLRLKRSFVPNGAHMKFMLPDTSLRDIQILGIRLGVTADEIMRGLVEMHLASSDLESGLRNFIPALQ